MQNIVITGSTRGIGLAMAIAFLKKGCQVTLSGRGEELAPSAKEQLKEFEKSCHHVCCDVTKKDSVENLFEESKKKWGNVEIWINNAGRNTPHVFSWETDKEHTDGVILTNLLGMVYGSQVAAKGMLLQGHGAIYSMEGLGSNKMVQVKTILYGTTKSALTYFMNGLAKELEGTGVIAGRLSPGMMLTDFITKMPDGALQSFYRIKSSKGFSTSLRTKRKPSQSFSYPGSSPTEKITQESPGLLEENLPGGSCRRRFVKTDSYKKHQIIGCFAWREVYGVLVMKHPGKG